MQLCVDIQSGLAQRAGVGRYTKALVEHLALQAGSDRLRLFYFDFRGRGCSFLPAGAQQRVVRWLPGRVAGKLWMHGFGPAFDRFAGAADVYFFPNFILPPLTRGRSAVTLHDISFLRHPEAAEERNLRHLRRRIHDTARRADVILTDSHFCAAEIREHLEVAPEKVHAIHLGLESTFRRPSDEVLAGYRRRAGLDKPYLLCIGTLEPRKNHGFLADVFDRLDADVDLVIAGQLGWKYEPILERLAASPRSARIHRLDYVDEADLPALYAGAELFVFPSLYEGFGFPPLEAMACGTPVVAAARGSLPEVLGEGALLLDTFETQTWADCISSLLQSPEERRAWSERGRQWCARYTWQATADATWNVFRSLGAS